MSKKQTPNWQPISALPMIAKVIDGILKDTEIQYSSVLKAKDQPYVLDNAIVERMLRVYKEQLENLLLFDEQLSRWEKENLRPYQEQEIERLKKQVEQTRNVTQSILDLTEKIKDWTIEKVMQKSDEEIGLDVLLGKLKGKEM